MSKKNLHKERRRISLVALTSLGLALALGAWIGLSGSPSALAAPAPMPALQNTTPNEVCLGCHEKMKTFFQFGRSVHKLSAVGCDSCHQVHGAQASERLLKKKDPDLCFACHGDVKSKFYLSHNHRVLQGALKCSDCHTPHGTRNRAGLRKTNTVAKYEVCFNCHPEKRGPWVYEHLTQKAEGCSSCHGVHGSPNPYLLTYRSARELCSQCHGIPHFATVSCVNCHTQIHGSNFSSRFLQ